ncbi:hypothetical protein LIER_08094 [Lithospermum erythrorhizon]|uniref:Uncharacterized protein n=1 Tax=Lithospermum erythrorhizon TaxID=34254 RepID=A0AAV3PAJ6_LITER
MAKKVVDDLSLRAADLGWVVIPSTVDAPPRPLFSKQMKPIARKLPTTCILDLTEEALATATSKEKDSHEPTPEKASSRSRGESDCSPKAKIGYSANYLELPYTLPGGFKITKDSTLWKKRDAFRTTRPLFLKRLGKDFEEFRDPLEIHGSIMKHDALKESFTKLEGDNFDLSSKVNKLQLFLDRATKRANKAEEKAKATQETTNAVTAQRVPEGIKSFKGSDEYALKDGKEAAYCLCHFEKSYRDVCSTIVDHYQSFIQQYPGDWFFDVDISAPLSPAEGDEA